jgi:hypothetical protein
MITNFDKSNIQGSDSESIFLQFLKITGKTDTVIDLKITDDIKELKHKLQENKQNVSKVIIDVRKNKLYQIKDIDFITYDAKNNKMVNFDVKLDTRVHDTDNYLLEIYSNYETRKIGWGLTTESDYIVVHEPQTNFLHFINMRKCRQYLLENWQKHKLVASTTNMMYTSKAILINTQELIEKIGKIKIYNYNTKKWVIA